MEKENSNIKFSGPANYQIIIKGELSDDWSDRLRGMKIIIDRKRYSKPVSILSGIVPDQAALSGVLNTLYDLHLSIISVEKL